MISFDLRTPPEGPGVRRAGLAKAEPGADAGPRRRRRRRRRLDQSKE
jgi:hypothetical protein